MNPTEAQLRHHMDQLMAETDEMARSHGVLPRRELEKQLAKVKDERDELLAALKQLLEKVPEPVMEQASHDSPPEYTTSEDYHLAHALSEAHAAIAKAEGGAN